MAKLFDVSLNTSVVNADGILLWLPVDGSDNSLLLRATFRLTEQQYEYVKLWLE